jgi:predicted transcriptional regulator of viral defense system
LFFSSKPHSRGSFVKKNKMALQARSLSPQESGRVLKGVAREDIIKLLGARSKAVDNIMESLRRKGWLERDSWGKYLPIPADQGREALGNSNLLAQASLIAKPYYNYIGYDTAAAHYGLRQPSIAT